ncbi:MAG: hypothetical protein AABN33_01790 [Acidobacteriota bacterium]
MRISRHRKVSARRQQPNSWKSVAYYVAFIRPVLSAAIRVAPRSAHVKLLVAFFVVGISAAVFIARPRPVARAAAQAGPVHVLSFPYYSIKGGWDSSLTLNNSSVTELLATVTLYSLDGEALRLPGVYLKPNSNIAVSLSELISPSPRRGQFQEGSIDVRFNSNDSMAIAPQLTVSDSQHGLSFDMEPPMMLMSSTLEGLWWSPDKKTSGQVMISNTTNQNLEVLVNVQWRGAVIPAPLVSLSAHQTTVLEIEKLLKSIRIEVQDIERGGLSLTHNSSPGALCAHGVIQNKEARFASNLPFIDPAIQKNSVLNGTGLTLGHPAPGTVFSEASFFTPHLALKNALKIPQTATISVRYLVQEALRTKTLPIVNLAPSEVRMADFSALMSELRNVSVTAAELRIESSGAPGSLIAALSSVDGSQSVEVDVPLVSRSERSGEGGNHPFRVGEEFRSVAYLTNITQKPTKVAVIIFHEGGMYTPELMSVSAGATLAIDLLQLRDSQAKDIQGRTLPMNLTQGQFFWHPHQAEALIGRIVTFDKASSTASNFSCPNCCQLEPGRIDILPSPITGAIGDFCQLTVYEWDTYCGQFQVGPYNYTNSVNYSCDDTSIATVNSSGGVSCIGVGYATITVSFDYYHSDYISAEDCGLFLATATATAPVAVTPRISGPTDLWWFNGLTPAGYDTQITLTATPATASSYQWTVVAGTDKVNFSNAADSITTGTNQATVVSTGASAFHEVKIRVTVNGISSAKFMLSVRAPYRLVLNQDFIHGFDQTYGYMTEIHYHIEDQFMDFLPSDVPINEQFGAVVNDYSGTNWRVGIPRGVLVGPMDWADIIQGEDNITAGIPLSTAPCSPSLCNTKVHHWSQDWRVGSTSIGVGVRVQTDTLQKYTDHGSHQNRVSPAP